MEHIGLLMVLTVAAIISSCGIAPPANTSPQPIIVHTQIPTSTPTTTIAPTVILQPSPTVVSHLMADTVLLNSGFVHRSDKDSADKCMAVGCKYYESITDGITVYTFPDTDSLILWVSNSGAQNATQKTTLALVITQLFGQDVNSWIFTHLAAYANANQEGHIDNRDISIQFIPLGTELTMIGIGPAQ
jgi:hypothetical protein